MLFGKYSLSETSVSNSRYFKRANAIWRRRLTPDGQVFSTREEVDLTKLCVVKKSGATESYQSAKLLLGLVRALDHRKSAPKDAWHIMQTIQLGLLSRIDNDFRVSVADIALLSLETLKRFDSAAYVKYASYQVDLVGKRQLQRLLKTA